MSKFEGFFSLQNQNVFICSNSLNCRQDYQFQYFLSVLFFEDYFLNYDWSFKIFLNNKFYKSSKFPDNNFLSKIIKNILRFVYI